MQDPSSRSEILEALKEVHQKVTNQYASIDRDRFFINHPPEWSPAEQLLHLIKSVGALSKGLKLPRAAISLMFGTAKAAGKNYSEIRDGYLAKLSGGAKATGKFVPSIDPNPQDASAEKERMLNKWNEVSDRLESSLESWSEEDLDGYLMPHPILGKLTVREMLFFTVYHNHHHLEREIKRGAVAAETQPHEPQ